MTEQDPRLVAVLGDLHGNTRYAISQVLDACQRLTEAGQERKIILQAGDFGIWPDEGGQYYLNRLNETLQHAAADLWFIRGNHDDCDQISEFLAGSDPGDLVTVRSRIKMIPDGYTWEWNGRTWIGIGGAVSVDRSIRTEGLDWWPGEQLSEEAACEIMKSGHLADVMLSHDSPASVPITYGPRPSWFLDRDLDMSGVHRERLQRVTDVLRPGYVIHGHHHQWWQKRVAMDHGEVLVTCLDCDGVEQGNLMILDTQTMEWQLG